MTAGDYASAYWARWLCAAPGDLNCDGRVDFSDIHPFVLALSDPPACHDAHPNFDIMNGDYSGDKQVSFQGIDAFVALLGGR